MIDWAHAEGKLILPAERIWLRDAAQWIAQNFLEPVIVNIGIYKCATMYCLRAGAPEATMIGVDLQPPQALIHPDLKAKFIIEDSRTCHSKVSSSIHLLFHDGDHNYTGVKTDISNWVSKVIIGGLVVFHDYDLSRHNRKKRPWALGVERAVNEWFALGGWKKLNAPDSLGAFQRLK